MWFCNIILVLLENVDIFDRFKVVVGLLLLVFRNVIFYDLVVW